MRIFLNADITVIPDVTLTVPPLMVRELPAATATEPLMVPPERPPSQAEPRSSAA